MKRKDFVYSVGKAFEIIEMLSRYPSGLTISYISSELDGAKVRFTGFYQHYLSWLCWAKQDGSYRLSLKFLAISNSLINSLELRDVAKPFLKRLAEEAMLMCI